MRFLRVLYVQVLLAIAAGIALGALAPGLGTELKWLADAFIKLIKLVIAPVIFCTVAAEKRCPLWRASTTTKSLPRPFIFK